ncbi:hypothetical protein [Gloeothece verrucosa]|uniref:Uncharacterized protein n=1 Tax=Gloeothece verrucosa (strain PCC 7822) TaxID=497965 RepID=E0UFV4_GLOV7|nr:hypothetical protein [Gloeothece verrucosa]ADN14337.1 hypothetical protein Cyan7822_2359 [Gloeothece verrucosa PCC 7822]
MSDQPSLTYHKRVAQILASFSLQGNHAPLGQIRNPLDQPVKAKPLAPLTSLGQLCAAVGVGYEGPLIKIPIPKDVDNLTTLTPRQELENRPITAQGFLDYSGEKVKLRNFYQTPIHILNYNDIIEDGWQLDFKGSGATIEGISLAYEYHNKYLDINKAFCIKKCKTLLTLTHCPFPLPLCPISQLTLILSTYLLD